jgi:hypothetical protein
MCAHSLVSRLPLPVPTAGAVTRRPSGWNRWTGGRRSTQPPPTSRTTARWWGSLSCFTTRGRCGRPTWTTPRSSGAACSQAGRLVESTLTALENWGLVIPRKAVVSRRNLTTKSQSWYCNVWNGIADSQARTSNGFMRTCLPQNLIILSIWWLQYDDADGEEFSLPWDKKF